MNTLNKIKYIAGALALASLIATPAFAQTGIAVGTSANATVSVPANVLNVITHSDTEITARINSLNAIMTRISAMVKVSSDQKAAFTTSLQNEISQLNTLKVKIDADTDITTAKADYATITKSYRIYALVLPQTTIVAAADRLMTIVDLFGTLNVKLQTRISAVPAGTDVSAMTSLLADANTKVADANAQSQTAVSAVASLQPDGGDATIMASNTAALTGARDDLKTARADLVTARQDVGTIVQDLKGIKGSASASASANAQP